MNSVWQSVKSIMGMRPFKTFTLSRAICGKSEERGGGDVVGKQWRKSYADSRPDSGELKRGR